MNRVLVLRPEPGASLTVEKARQQGLDAVALALFCAVAVLLLLTPCVVEGDRLVCGAEDDPFMLCRK